MKRATKPMRQASPALAKRRREYSKRRLIFLAREENQWCPVAAAGVWGAPAQIPTTDIHHTNKRDGRKLLDEKYWLAVSRVGHEFIHAWPNIAREHGWLV